jgi:hypothetical protein
LRHSARRGFNSAQGRLVSIGFGILALLCFGMACVAPHAIGTCPGSKSSFDVHPAYVHWFDGSTIVLFGWLGGIFAQFGWYANLTAVALLFGAIVRRRRFPIAVLVAHTILVAFAVAPIPLAHSEAGAEPVCLGGYGAGFAFWLGWVLFAALAAVAHPDQGGETL